MRIAECGDGLVCGEGDVLGATFIADSADFKKGELFDVGFGPDENILLGVE